VTFLNDSPRRLIEFRPTSDELSWSSQEIVAIEDHADHAAVGSICYRIIMGNDSIRDVVALDIPILYRIGILQIAAALMCLSWLFYLSRHRLVPPEHPPIRVRYLGMQLAIKQIMEQNNQRDLYIKSTQWAYHQLALLTKRSDLFSPLASLASPKIMAHVSAEREKILDVLSQLKEKLLPFN
jgi:hypothetical protein